MCTQPSNNLYFFIFHTHIIHIYIYATTVTYFHLIFSPSNKKAITDRQIRAFKSTFRFFSSFPPRRPQPRIFFPPSKPEFFVSRVIVNEVQRSYSNQQQSAAYFNPTYIKGWFLRTCISTLSIKGTKVPSRTPEPACAERNPGEKEAPGKMSVLTPLLKTVFYRSFASPRLASLSRFRTPNVCNHPQINYPGAPPFTLAA